MLSCSTRVTNWVMKVGYKVALCLMNYLSGAPLTQRHFRGTVLDNYGQSYAAKYAHLSLLAPALQ